MFFTRQSFVEQSRPVQGEGKVLCPKRVVERVVIILGLLMLNALSADKALYSF